MRTKKNTEIAINLTPLIDVVFLLLIFFMVSTTFTRETQLKLDLPQADVEKLETEPDTLEVSLDKEGRLFVNGKPLINSQAETLEKAILPIYQKNQNIPMIISADAQTAYQPVIDVMTVASNLGISNIKLAAQRSKE